jgi:lipid A 4'-phosphatase
LGILVAVVFDAREDRRADLFRKSFARITLAISIAAAVLFVLAPDLDLWAAKAFYLGDGRFAGSRAGGLGFLRWFFVCLYLSCIGLAIAGIVLSRARRQRWMGLGMGQWLFLAACLGTGPGLVANVLLKDQWGRARPSHVVEFGGTKSFSAPLTASGQCHRNCSFVSGEAASVFIIFYAAALVVPQLSLSFVAIGTVGGIAAGVVRMAQGAHFLSDVIFAGVFMALTALLVHKLMLGDRVARTVSSASLQSRSGAAIPP